MKLIEIDLTKGENKVHPEFDSTDWFLVKVFGKFLVGKFGKTWFGYNFHGGVMCIQYDMPGTNASSWEKVWKIVE